MHQGLGGGGALGNKSPCSAGKTLNSKHTTAVSTGLIWTAVHHRTCCPLFTWSVLSLPNKLWPEGQMGGGGPAVVCHPSRWGDGQQKERERDKEQVEREREQGKGQLDHGWSKALSKHVGEAAEEGDLSRYMILWPRINSMCKNCTLHAPCTMCTGPVKTHCRISHRGWSFYKNKVAEFYDCQRFYMCSVSLRKTLGLLHNTLN